VTKSCKVLFISAPVGAGHIQAAKSVSAAMCRQYNDVETKIANVFDFFNPYLGNNILRIYLKILKIFPQLYGMMYGWGNESKFALFCRQVVSRFLSQRMENYIMEYNPSVIVCTHATPAGLVAYLMKQKKLSIPVIVIVTDYVVHRLWVYSEIKHYIVANENMRDYLAKCGVPYACTEVMGIPVDEKFSCKPDKQKIISKLQFSNHIKTILIMGGGAGILPMDEIVLHCERMNIPLQIIVVTGNNKSMYKKVLNLQLSLHIKVQVLGYVDYVHELMAISDLIISKPGGMTSAESLCSGVPILIYRPIPGQEEANTKYLVENDVALRAECLQDMQLILKNLFVDHPEELAILQQNALRLAQPMSASNIAKYIFSKVADYKNKDLDSI
jgi:processive 1,2-diacylglycerol beta-glucosyltransferase